MFSSISYHFSIGVEFERDLPDGETQSIRAGFHVPLQTTSQPNEFDIEHVISTINLAIENFNRRGSQWLPVKVYDFRIFTAPYRPMNGGSSYIPAPQHIQNKHCCINIENNDNFCFLWSILAQLHPVNQNRHRVNNYRPYLHELNYHGLNSP